MITYAGSGSAGSNDGQLNQARFNKPNGIAIDSSGNVYVADRGNDKIRKISVWGGFSISGTDSAGNRIDQNQSNLSTSNSISVDNDPPSVKFISLNTDNSIGENPLDSSGNKISNQFMSLSGDNVTLSFETTERVFSPKITINSSQKDAVAQSGDLTGTKWEAGYRVTGTDSGMISFSGFDATDVVGHALTYDPSSVTPTSLVLVDNNQPVISAVSIIELDSDNQTKYGENSIRILGPGMTLKLQFNADESILEPSITLKVDGVNDNVDTGSLRQWDTMVSQLSGRRYIRRTIELGDQWDRPCR